MGTPDLYWWWIGKINFLFKAIKTFSFKAKLSRNIYDIFVLNISKYEISSSKSNRIIKKLMDYEELLDQEDKMIIDQTFK